MTEVMGQRATLRLLLPVRLGGECELMGRSEAVFVELISGTIATFITRGVRWQAKRRHAFLLLIPQVATFCSQVFQAHFF